MEILLFLCHNQTNMNKPDTPTFSDLLKEREIAEAYIRGIVEFLKQNNLWKELLDIYDRASTTDSDAAYPDQGLVITDYDEQPAELTTQQLDQDIVEKTIHAWLYYLEVFNHPERLEALFRENEADFVPPQASDNQLLDDHTHEIIGINEFSLTPTGSNKDRTKRTERFKNGPFVKLGRQARIPFVGSANPDIWGSTPAIASMAMSHSLCGVPRDGFYSDPERQADLAKSVFEMLEKSPALIGKEPDVQDQLLEMWKHNVMGVLEANPEKAIDRATILYEAGVRTFRIYSPEPGLGPLQTLEKLREREKELGWEPIEIFVGQVVDLNQALTLEKAGADGIYLGIGGGGRCTTGVRSGVGINWPQLVWEMRGKLTIPIIVEGGGSDYVAQSLSLGTTGIGVTRAAGGGTIESPGGSLYFDSTEGLWKPYRGEASAGMKAMGGRIGPFGFIPYVEGEGTKAYLEHGRGNVPTILQNLNLLLGDAIMAHVFQNVQSIEELQKVGAESLRLSGAGEVAIRHTH
jgi:hypothetical protein